MSHSKKILTSAIILALLLPLFSSCGVFSFQSRKETPPLGREVGLKPTYLLVGAMGQEAKEGAVYSFYFNPLDHKVSHKGTFNTPSPSFMASRLNGATVFITNELAEEATVTAATFHRNSGTLSMLNQSYTVGKEPTYVAVQDNKVVTANYGDGSITMFYVERDGSLGQADWRIQLGEEGHSHPHAAYFTPNGDELYVTDLGLDKVYQFGVHSGTPPLTIQQNEVTLPAGVGPRHILFDQSGKFAYINGEKRPLVYVYKKERGTLTFLQEIETGKPATGSGAHIAMSPDGRFLYTSHRDVGDGISIFSIDERSRKLQRVDVISTGRHPRHFAISPDGQFLAVACRDSNEVAIYARDVSSGKLEPNPIRIEVQKPISLLWIGQ